jgi:hypothetical protein
MQVNKQKLVTKKAGFYRHPFMPRNAVFMPVDKFENAMEKIFSVDNFWSVQTAFNPYPAGNP